MQINKSNEEPQIVDFPKLLTANNQSEHSDYQSEYEYVVVEIKKNQFDAMAGIIYSNGVSLMHWALGFGLFFVEWPDVDLAIKEE